MKAVKVEADRSLRWGEVPDPVAGPDEVLVDIYATALNRADLLQREGKYPPPPGWPEWMGLEIAGVVAAVGARVSGWRPGDRVCALLGGGGYAEKIAVDARMLMRLPATCSMAEAASLPEAYATSWLNLVIEGALRPGETVLVQAGASGLGMAAIQLAKFLGAKVVATVGTPAKAEAVRRLGADVVVDRTADDLGAALDAHPVDVALDCVGGEALARNLEKMAPGGRWILISTLGGEFANVSLRPVLKRGLRLIGSTLRSRAPETKARILRELEAGVWPVIERGEIKPVLHATLPVTEAEAAHGMLQRNENIGKVVLLTRERTCP